MFKIAGVDLVLFLDANDRQRLNMLSIVNDKISELIKSNWKEQSLDFLLSIGTNNTIMTSFQENGQNIEPGKRSEGFKWYLSFLLDFNANFGSEIKNCLILLDEPGIHLHPGGQRMLLKQIEDLSKNNQIIYTTHLPFMINKMFPNRIIYLNKKRGITELKKPRKEGVFDDILLSSTLGYNFTSLSNWGEINVFVEGITDKILLKKIILEKANKDKEIILDLNEFSLLNIQGVHNLNNFIRVAQLTDAKYITFLDNDNEAKEQTKKYEKRPKSHPDTIDHIIFLDENKTLEDYIPLLILNEAFENLKNSDIFFSSFIKKNEEFDDELRSPQIKEFIEKINSNIKSTNNEEFEEITKGDFKLELIIRVNKLITENNIDNFNELIEKIKSIMILAEKLFNL